MCRVYREDIVSTLIEDARAAIVTLTEEAKQTRLDLADLERTITERRLPERDNMKQLAPDERERILEAYAQHAEDQARRSGMKKRLDFIDREIGHWQERIDIATEQTK